MRKWKKTALLVLGSEGNRTFRETLRELHMNPTFLGSMEAILYALRHSQAVAVLVDRDRSEADDLELVLNIRDLDETIPIFLVGSPAQRQTETLLWRQPATFLINKPLSDTSLGQELVPFMQVDASGSLSVPEEQ